MKMNNNSNKLLTEKRQSSRNTLLVFKNFKKITS